MFNENSSISYYMIKNIIITTSLFLFSSNILALDTTIKKNHDNTIFKESNPEFDTFIDEFFNDLRYYSEQNNPKNNAIINFLDSSFFQKQFKNKHIAGVCIKYTNNKREVIINSDFWYQTEVLADSYYLKKQLIYHELGHCVLDREHHNQELSHLKLSIMNSSLFGHKEYYQINESLFIEELFKNNAKETTFSLDY